MKLNAYSTYGLKLLGYRRLGYIVLLKNKTETCFMNEFITCFINEYLNKNSIRSNILLFERNL